MTPGARISAAIEVLDAIGAGAAPEQTLARWARASRFAGSKDRAAVRDHVFDGLRNWRSDAARGGAETGRARMIGRLRAEGIAPETLFDGVGHAPAPLSADEQKAGRAPSPGGEALNLPDWLVPHWQAALGPQAEAAAQHAMARAPITLRARTDRVSVADVLAQEGIETVANPRAPQALTVTAGARRLRGSDAFAAGLFEMQDAASQAVIAGLSGSGTALDYCAGGGGKSLALADQGWRVTAHDIDAERMVDLPVRAARAGVEITRAAPEEITGTFDLVLCDAPCSGSGAWRRAPQGKWALTEARLEELQRLQGEVLDAALKHVAPGGQLVYATCSVLEAENAASVRAFLGAHPDWEMTDERHLPLDAWQDGFFVACLRRA